MWEKESTIVIDNGSGMIKPGFNENKMPQSVFPTMVNRPKVRPQYVNQFNKQYFIGNETSDKLGFLFMNSSAERGIIYDWKDMEKIWHDTFIKNLKLIH
jgi:actin-related protein